MPLETSTFISGLTETWPVTGDPKSQGDDHLRLIKAVLKGTFPTGSKAFYFPTTTAISGTLTLTAADQNNVIEVTTTSGNVTVNLPSTLGVGDKGWSCDIVKVSNDANAAIVTPASGTILSKCGTTATIRVGIFCEPATLTWNGTSWRCAKPGPMIGSTENFDGAGLPAGYLLADGSAYSNNFGATAVLGAVGGIENRTVAQVNLPSVNFPVGDPGHTHTGTVAFSPSGQAQAGIAGGTIVANPTGVTISNNLTGISVGSGGSNIPIAIAQPTIIVNKIVRAC